MRTRHARDAWKGSAWLALVCGAGAVHAQAGAFRQAAGKEPLPPDDLYGIVHRFLPDLPSRAVRYVAGDLDGDGHADLVAGTSETSAYVLAGDGKGSFLDVLARVELDAPAGRMALGDVDGDGDRDLYLGASSLLLNDGAGGFSDSGAGLPAVATGSFKGLWDVDQDGDLDVLTWSIDTAHLQLRNDGAGGFTDWSASMPPAFQPLDVEMGDVDGDGDPDALAGVLGGHRLYLDQAGTYVDASGNLSTPLFTFTAVNVALADADLDGDLDAFFLRDEVGSFGSGFSGLQKNDGTGVFTVAPVLFSSSGNRFEVGDFDGDGDPDVLTSQVYWNNGSGSLSQGPVPVLGSSRVFPLLVVDVDEDDDLDFLVLRNDNVDDVFFNDGSGSWKSGRGDVTALGNNLSRIALADMDGDEDLDAFALDAGVFTSSYSVQPFPLLFRNDGSGTLESVALPVLPIRPVDVATGDLDEDGAIDVALAGLSSTRAFLLLLNRGAPSFVEPAAYPVVTGDTRSVALGDVDGDGHLDGLFGSLDASTNDLLILGDGAGGFTHAASNLPLDAAPTSAVELGDVDGDGDLDAVLGNTGGSPSALYANDGAGLFSLAVPALPSGVETAPEDLLLVDLELDGDLDLLIANGLRTSPQPIVLLPDLLFTNEGAGVFVDASHRLPSTDGLGRQIGAADVDGNGTVDIVSRGTVWLGDGSGGFEELDGLAGLVGTPKDTALGDIDGDGDPDIVGYVGRRNLRRQVAWHGHPVAGEALVLDLHGDRLAPWWVWGSTGRTNLELPPFGTLLIDPGQAVLLGAGRLDRHGTFRYPIAPALLPVMASQTLHVQAIVGSPLGFTNLENAVFTGP